MEKGTHVPSLNDMTGLDGRCDAVFLTNKHEKILGSEQIDKIRDSLSSKLVFKEYNNYDLVVVGGGVAGMCVAISASRLGCKVALLHDRPVLGGAIVRK